MRRLSPTRELRYISPKCLKTSYILLIFCVYWYSVHTRYLIFLSVRFDGNEINDWLRKGWWHGLNDEEIANEEDESNEGGNENSSDEGNYEDGWSCVVFDRTSSNIRDWTLLEACVKQLYLARAMNGSRKKVSNLILLLVRFEIGFPLSLSGCAFHASHRIIVPVDHDYRTVLYATLGEAIYAWDEEEIADL